MRDEITNKDLEEFKVGLKILKMLSNEDLSYVICAFNIMNNTFSWMSASAKKILGYEPSEFKGKGLEDFIDMDYYEASIKQVEENMRKGISVDSFPNVYIKPDGTKVLMLWVTDGLHEKISISKGFRITKDVLNTLNEIQNKIDNE